MTRETLFHTRTELQENHTILRSASEKKVRVRGKCAVPDVCIVYTYFVQKRFVTRQAVTHTIIFESVVLGTKMSNPQRISNSDAALTRWPRSLSSVGFGKQQCDLVIIGLKKILHSVWLICLTSHVLALLLSSVRFHLARRFSDHRRRLWSNTEFHQAASEFLGVGVRA